MGLDVFFVRTNGEKVLWENPIMGDFPFEAQYKEYPIYDEYGDFVMGKQPYIGEVNGMYPYGAVSFRGRGYSWLCDELGFPNFYQDQSPQELKNLCQAFGTWLNDHRNDPDNMKVGDESIWKIRQLHTLLEWAVSHGLGTSESL
jgi:hypothetical protein